MAAAMASLHGEVVVQRLQRAGVDVGVEPRFRPHVLTERLPIGTGRVD